MSLKHSPNNQSKHERSDKKRPTWRKAAALGMMATTLAGGGYFIGKNSGQAVPADSAETRPEQVMDDRARQEIARINTAIQMGETFNAQWYANATLEFSNGVRAYNVMVLPKSDKSKFTNPADNYFLFAGAIDFGLNGPVPELRVVNGTADMKLIPQEDGAQITVVQTEFYRNIAWAPGDLQSPVLLGKMPSGSVSPASMVAVGMK